MDRDWSLRPIRTAWSCGRRFSMSAEVLVLVVVVRGSNPESSSSSSDIAPRTRLVARPSRWRILSADLLAHRRRQCSSRSRDEVLTPIDHTDWRGT